MTQEQTRPITRYLGGEGAHRSFFGGTHSRGRIFFVLLFFIATLVLTPIFGIWGIAIGVVGGGVTILVTASTHRGSIAERRTRRARWAARVAAGTDAFEPYEVGAWDQLQRKVDDAALLKGRGSRQARWAAARELAAMRANPDGSDGMGWLQMARRVPGIAWHAPVGESQYLSVTFSVEGQLRGIESTAVMSRAAQSWGSFLAARAASSSLVGDVQMTTRVLPADTAENEWWASESMDPDAPAEAVASYEEVLRLTGQNAMVQRHFVTVKWPLNESFYSAAEKYGRGRDGWRGLMESEISATARGLREARMGRVTVLSARETTAAILHMQNPDRPIRWMSDIVSPSDTGVRSYDEFSAHVVSGFDPLDGRPVEWWHRTAAIRADALSASARTQLWVLGLLIGEQLNFVRTIAFHLHLVPAAEAKAAARQDLVRDAADSQSRLEAGQLDNDVTGVHMSAARRRRDDLISGSQHHGASWIGYVTISVRSREELARASRQLEDACQTSLGIERLDWQDSYQAAASGTTWPIARGLRAGRATFATRVYDRLAGKSEKEAIS